MMLLFTNPRSRMRRALTLVELMVAIAVISVLAGIALPTVKNSLKGQRLNRAASLLQSAIEEARGRSIANGGGSGIIIDRVGIDNVSQRCESTRVRLASTPPSYTGEPGGDRLVIGVNPGTLVANDVIAFWFSPYATQMVRAATDLNASANEQTLFRPGNYVQLSGGSVPFRITNIAFGTAALRTSDNVDAVVPLGDVTAWVRVLVTRLEPQQNLRRIVGTQASFHVTREPRAAIAAPIELTRGAAIDLTSSGVGRYGNQFSPMFAEGNYIDTTLAPFTNAAPINYQSIFIIFGARGEVSQVIASVSTVPGSPVSVEIPLTGDIFLLVGDAGEVKTDPSEQLEDTDPDASADDARDGIAPVLNKESIWVTIKVRNGDIVSSAWIDPTDQDSATDPLVPTPANVPPIDNVNQQNRIQTVLGRTRSGAVDGRSLGSI